MTTTLTYADLNALFGRGVAQRGEWCGVPIPLPGMRLSVESRNPYAARLAEAQAIVDNGGSEEDDGDERVAIQREDGADDDWAYVNTWWSTRLRRTIGIARHVSTGRLSWFAGTYDYVRKGTFALRTIGAATVWPLDAEMKAIDTLATHLSARPHLFDMYLCTGSFLETSPRSHLTYIFRRCRPTLVYNARRQQMLCALCLHPIGYYTNTHAGSMVPTDDVIAHLLMMRADEPFYWRRANQHPLDRPEAGL